MPARKRAKHKAPGARSEGRVATLEECGQQLGLTRERIRQIENAALKKLRMQLEARGIDEALWFSHLADLDRLNRTSYAPGPMFIHARILNDDSAESGN